MARITALPPPPVGCLDCRGTGKRGSGKCTTCAGRGHGKDMRPAWLKLVRSTFGLKQRELAEILDMQSVTVSRWERGETEPMSWRMLELALHQIDPNGG